MKSIEFASNNFNLIFKNALTFKTCQPKKVLKSKFQKAIFLIQIKTQHKNNSKISPAYVYEKGSSANEFYGKIVCEKTQSKICVLQQQENSIKAMSNNVTNSTSKKIISALTIPSTFRKLENTVKDIDKKISEHLKKTEINVIRKDLKAGLEALRAVKGNELKYAINFLEHSLQDKPSDIKITNEKSELTQKIKNNIDL